MDSLQAVIAELRDRTKWFVHLGDKWKEGIADRLERIDAEMRDDIERYRYIQRTGFTPGNDRFGRVLFGDALNAWVDARKTPPEAIAAEARKVVV